MHLGSGAFLPAAAILVSIWFGQGRQNRVVPWPGDVDSDPLGTEYLGSFQKKSSQIIRALLEKHIGPKTL
jgi:hypothetical protein